MFCVTWKATLRKEKKEVTCGVYVGKIKLGLDIIS